MGGIPPEAQQLIKVCNLLIVARQKLNPPGLERWPNRIALAYLRQAWDALNAAATDTELIALLHSTDEHTDLLRGLTEDVVDVIQRTLADMRVQAWQEELDIWRKSIPPISQSMDEASLSDPNTLEGLMKSLVKCKAFVEQLVAKSVRLMPLSSGPATDKEACYERVVRGNLAHATLEQLLFVLERQAERAAASLRDSITITERKKQGSVGLRAINNAYADLKGKYVPMHPPFQPLAQ